MHFSSSGVWISVLRFVCCEHPAAFQIFLDKEERASVPSWGTGTAVLGISSAFGATTSGNSRAYDTTTVQCRSSGCQDVTPSSAALVSDGCLVTFDSGHSCRKLYISQRHPKKVYIPKLLWLPQKMSSFAFLRLCLVNDRK